MRLTYVCLGALVGAVLSAMEAATRAVPWGPAKVVVWFPSVVVLFCLVFTAVRTARRLAVAPLQQSQRDVYAIALVGLVLALLALSLPRVVAIVAASPSR